MPLGILTGFLAASLGWQINLITIHRGLERGRFAAFLVGCGSVMADMIFLWFVLAGTAPVLEHPEWWGIIRWTGIIVLLLLAVRVLFFGGKTESDGGEVEKRNPTKNFLVGLLVVGTNPVIFLLWIGVIGFLRVHFPETRQPWFKEFFLAGFLTGAMCWFVPLAFIFLKRLARWSEKNHSFLTRLSGGFLVLVAVYLIFFEKF